MQAEQREYEEGQRTNRELEAQRQALAQKLSETKEQVASVSHEATLLQSTLAEQESMQRFLSFQETLEATLNCEKLGLSVESVERDITKLAFKYIDPTDWERRFVICIDVGGVDKSYRVKACDPMLPNLSTLLMKLEEGNDFFTFLGRVRQAFIDIISVK